LAFSTAEKIRVGKLLSALGVDVIEAGTPAMGKVEQEAVAALVQAGLKAEITAWNRVHRADIEASLACGVTLVHLSAPVSDIHLRYKLGRDRDWVLGQMTEMAAYARSRGCRVSVGAEDASRANPDFLAAYAQAARQAGAQRLRVCDTLGVLDPFRTAALVGRLTAAEAGLPLEIHAHDDFGLALANTLAALRAGARAASVTVNGIGERAGNADLGEVVRAVRRFCSWETGVDARRLKSLERVVHRLCHRSGTRAGEAVWRPAF
jgi:homocitrate synthase NifV